jgi:hypothetical protein
MLDLFHNGVDMGPSQDLEQPGQRTSAVILLLVSHQLPNHSVSEPPLEQRFGHDHPDRPSKDRQCREARTSRLEAPSKRHTRQSSHIS